MAAAGSAVAGNFDFLFKILLIGDAGVSSLLLVCVVFALAYQSTNDIDNTNEENLGVRMGAQQMSMSMGRSIQVMAASEEVPVFAAFMCVVSMAAGLLTLWQNRKPFANDGLCTTSASEEPLGNKLTVTPSCIPSVQIVPATMVRLVSK